MQRSGILFYLLVLFLAGCLSAPLQTKTPKVDYQALIQEAKAESGEGLNQTVLQYQIMSFADRYASLVANATHLFEKRLQTPKARLQAKRTQFYSLSAAFDIAVSPSPEAALLDMAVLVTLNRMIWDEYWREEVFGPPADIMVEAYQNLETDIWSILNQVLSAKQQEGLRNLITQWRVANPQQVAVNYIRLNDFGKLRGASQSKGSSSGGLLAAVSEATQAVDDTLLLAERARFLLSRTQLLVGLQVELVFMEISIKPEIRQLQTDISEFANLAEWVQDELPQTLAKEREAAINQLMTEISSERETAVDQLMSKLSAEREVAIQQAMDSITNEREATITQFMAEFGVERNKTITQAINSLAGEREGLEKQLVEAQNHMFILAMSLLIATLCGLVGAMLIYRFLVRKLFKPKAGETDQSIPV